MRGYKYGLKNLPYFADPDFNLKVDCLDSSKFLHGEFHRNYGLSNRRLIKKFDIFCLQKSCTQKIMDFEQKYRHEDFYKNFDPIHNLQEDKWEQGHPLFGSRYYKFCIIKSNSREIWTFSISRQGVSDPWIDVNLIIGYTYVANISVRNYDHRDGSYKADMCIHDDWSTKSEKIFDALHYYMHFYKALHVFKKYAETEIRYLEPNKKIKQFNCIYKNELPYKIKMLDLNFFTKTIHTGPIRVSGHFKRQRYGKGRKKIKIIWRDSYIIPNMVREAEKDKETH